MMNHQAQPELVSAEPLDRELVVRSRSADADAFGALVDRYHTRLVGFLRRQSNDGELALDLAQETSELDFVRFKQHEDDSRFVPWLYQIVRNQLRSKQRKKNFRLLSLDLLQGERSPEVANEPLSAATDSVDGRDAIDRALAELTPILKV